MSKWIRNSQENNGILVVTSLSSRNWIQSLVSSSKQNGELTDTNAYLVIFSDDGRTGASNQSYLGKGIDETYWGFYVMHFDIVFKEVDLNRPIKSAAPLQCVINHPLHDCTR